MKKKILVIIISLIIMSISLVMARIGSNSTEEETVNKIVKVS
jgi:hypothetical protein